mmetsp:Transcript_15572/g.37408  ORF Transcript_15572/g.37408 Transcript_15572/m.37408 type:complete len:302 (-) Transcript_15572:77-982(-)
MEIVLDDVPVFETLLPFLFRDVHPLQHVLIPLRDLVSHHVVVRRRPVLHARGNALLGALHNLHVMSGFRRPYVRLLARISVLLNQRIEPVPLHVLRSSFPLVERVVPGELRVVITEIPVGHDVVILLGERWDLAVARLASTGLRPVIRMRPVMLMEPLVGDDIVVNKGVRKTLTAMHGLIRIPLAREVQPLQLGRIGYHVEGLLAQQLDIHGAVQMLDPVLLLAQPLPVFSRGLAISLVHGVKNALLLLHSATRHPHRRPSILIGQIRAALRSLVGQNLLGPCSAVGLQRIRPDLTSSMRS